LENHRAGRRSFSTAFTLRRLHSRNSKAHEQGRSHGLLRVASEDKHEVVAPVDAIVSIDTAGLDDSTYFFATLPVWHYSNRVGVHQFSRFRWRQQD